MKNALNRNNNKLGVVEEKISKLEDRATETIQKKHGEQKIILKKKRTSVSYGDIIKWPNTWVVEVAKEGGNIKNI